MNHTWICGEGKKFDCWIPSCNTCDYHKLKDRLPLKELKDSVRWETEVHLNEHDMTSPQHAAELDDSYEVAQVAVRILTEEVQLGQLG